MENKTAEEILKSKLDELSMNNGSFPNYKHWDKECRSYILEAMEEYASQQLAEKDKEIERYKEVLTELVELKKMKDSQGKTFIYCDRQPKAWQQAFDLIKSLNK